MTTDKKRPGAPLRVGIVGCGIIANAHLPYIRKAGGVPVAVADLSIRQSSELADRYGIQRVYRGVEEMLAAEQLDVVHVLTPPHTHARVAIAALERGVHALVEKPLALDPREVEAMKAAAERGGAMLTADHNRLFDPPMLAARRLWESGELGDLVAIESFQAGRASDRDWLGELAGGGIGDLVPHPLYLQLYFLGAVHDLHATAFSLGDSSAPQELRVLMQGENRTGMLTISTNAAPGLNTLKLCGTRMTVEVNLNNMTIVRRRDYDVPKIIAKPLPNLDEAWQLTRQTITNTLDFVRGRIRYYPGMGELIARFYEAIRSGTAAPVSIDEAAAVVEVTARIWQSLEKQERPTRSRVKTSPAPAAAVAV
ncbi:MAG TPA: Gfo/Idh/MocA family oxidoreductase [Candidatus Limnocylindrales bacterium]|nr:Gfo/Idh/MocA family oxidoreductase [Candidatus Limnocylindrales bacterium]